MAARDVTGRPTRALDERSVRLAMRRSYFDGTLWALMLGFGETYFVANAIAIGATPVEIGLLISVPLLLGSLGPIALLWLLRIVPRRRPFVVGSAAIQAAALFGLAFANHSGTLTAPVLIAIVALYHFCGQASGAAWSSWYGDLVPIRERGLYFAHRTRLIHLATFVALVTAGATLQVLEPAIGDPAGVAGGGFAVVLAVAAACRVGSALVLQRSPEPRYHGPASARSARRFLGTTRGRSSVRLLVGGGLFQAATYFASPFFTPYLLDDLAIGYLGLTAALGTQVAMKFVTMPYWGRRVDRVGPRRTLRVALVLAALVPLPYLWADGLVDVLLAHVLSGVAWGGYEVALLAFLLRVSRRSTRPHVFTAHSVCNALGQFSGTMSGAAVLSAHGYAWIFAGSLLLRSAVAAALPALVTDRHARGARRAPLVLRMLGARPVGFTHRPIEDAADERDAADA